MQRYTGLSDGVIGVVLQQGGIGPCGAKEHRAWERARARGRVKARVRRLIKAMVRWLMKARVRRLIKARVRRLIKARVRRLIKARLWLCGTRGPGPVI